MIMRPFLIKTLINHKIGIHNIINTNAIFKNNLDLNLDYFCKIALKFRTEPYSKCAYLIRNDGEYIKYDKMHIDTNEVFIKYTLKEYEYLKNDIFLLHKLGLEIKCDHIILKKITENVSHQDCRLIC
jgi:hypothetical protein